MKQDFNQDEFNKLSLAIGEYKQLGYMSYFKIFLILAIIFFAIYILELIFPNVIKSGNNDYINPFMFYAPKL